jgi:hypothetical protein
MKLIVCAAAMAALTATAGASGQEVYSETALDRDGLVSMMTAIGDTPSPHLKASKTQKSDERRAKKRAAEAAPAAADGRMVLAAAGRR